MIVPCVKIGRKSFVSLNRKKIETQTSLTDICTQPCTNLLPMHAHFVNRVYNTKALSPSARTLRKKINIY